MNPIHAAFVSDPAQPLLLEPLFAILDGIDPIERREWLSPVLVDLPWDRRWEGHDDESVSQDAYEHMKAACFALKKKINPHFMAYAIVARALSWLAYYASEKHVKMSLAGNELQKQRALDSLTTGDYTADQYHTCVGACDERINNMASDRVMSEHRYNRFCEIVVKPFLCFPPDEEA